MAAERQPIGICLIGPTAIGKTELATRLCDHFPLQIISVDSAQIYRGMDIGTAKPDRDTLCRYPHRLIDIRDPHECYSVAEFCRDARREVNAARTAGKLPLLVGGTMMYFHSLLKGIAKLPAADPSIRSRLQQQMEQKGMPELHARLRKIDPVTADKISSNDPQRILRALEVYEITGKPMSTLQQQDQQPPPLSSVLSIALMPSDRAQLHTRIASRFAHMLSDGLIDELVQLQKLYDLSAALPSMRCVGYRQAWLYLQGHYDKDTLCEKGTIATRQLAKRQMTWIRNQLETAIIPTDLSNLDKAFHKVRQMIENHNIPMFDRV